jgi:hypothetical protein
LTPTTHFENKHLLPFERQLLMAVRDTLPFPLLDRFDAQVLVINRVQRLLDWREIEFYRMHWFRVKWPESLLFDFKGEVLLEVVNCAFGEQKVKVEVFSVGGHLFSLESKVAMKQIHTVTPFAVLGVDLNLPI